MSKISNKLNYEAQFEQFKKSQFKKNEELIDEVDNIHYKLGGKLGKEIVINLLINYFFELDKNTFFSKLKKEDKSDYMLSLIGVIAITYKYNMDFVERIINSVADKVNSHNEKELMNKDIVEVLNKKTEPTAEPTKPKGLRV